VGKDLGDAGQIGGGELDVDGPGVLLEALGAAGAGNGCDVLALGEQPGQRELGGSDALGAGQTLYSLAGWWSGGGSLAGGPTAQGRVLEGRREIGGLVG
jgi:hypothetical protein